MNFIGPLTASCEALVHENARADARECARHGAFMRLRILLPLCAAVAAPLLLAIEGAPTIWQAMAFGFSVLPLLALVLVARTGALREGHMICVAAQGGLALSAALGSGLGLGAGAWLLLMPLEAAMTRDGRRIAVASAASLILIALLTLANAAGFLPSGPSPLADSLIGGAALLYVCGLVHDFLAEARASDAALAQEKARRLALEDLAGDAILVFTRHGAVVPGGVGDVLPGLARRKVSGRSFFERVQIADRPAFLKAVSDASSGMSAQLRLRLCVTEMDEAQERVFQKIDLRLRACPTGEGDVLALLRDASAQTDEEPAAHAQDERNRRTLANVGHELRTPLNAIIGFSEMLATSQAPADERQMREYAGIINTSGKHLLAVVNSILDMSRMEQGMFDLAAEPFELPSLVESCCDILRLKAREAGVDMLRDFVPARAELVGDKRACKQILLNLLSNAIKFTPAGGRVTIGLREEGEHVALFIADTGIGIAPADLPRLGHPFFQAQAAYHRAYEGTGLGLSLVKGLVGLHGGAMSIESAPGQGTCVTVRLPRDCRRTASADAAIIETISRTPAMTINDHSRVKKIA